MTEPEYSKIRKTYIPYLWLTTYFYNFIIVIFFFHPEIVDMNFNNINEHIIKLCRAFCLMDIILTPFFIKIIKCLTNDLFKDLELNVFNSLDEIKKFKDAEKARKEALKYEREVLRYGSRYGIHGQISVSYTHLTLPTTPYV